MRERERFRRRISVEFLDVVRARYALEERPHGELVLGLVDELLHAYEAILAPGYGFEAEMDRYRAQTALSESLAAELRETRARYERAARDAELLVKELAQRPALVTLGEATLLVNTITTAFFRGEASDDDRRNAGRIFQAALDAVRIARGAP